VEENALAAPEDARPIEIIDLASVSLVRERVRTESNVQGLSTEIAETLALLGTELATNLIVHAKHGEMRVRRIAREGVLGIEIAAADRGPGIADPKRALLGGSSTSGGLGNGIAACGRLADELDFDVRLGEGTEIRVRRFAAPVAYRSEVGVFGRALPGEQVSGDDAMFARRDDTLLCAVVDGLGHGPEAQAAARTATGALRAHEALPVLELVERVGRGLANTRGVSLAVARIDRGTSTLEHGGIGDIQTHTYRAGSSERFLSSAGVLDARSMPRRLTLHRAPIERGSVLVLFTDGVKSKMSLQEEFELLREHPIVIAQSIVERFARAEDDALVLVAR
jgi:anti-sigma regulatory factor (Ser/Thr protein kinase)